MSRPNRSWKVENWADFLPSKLGYCSAPVDLYAVARYRRVKRISFRFIVPRGLLLPIEGGFEVYIRDVVCKDFDLSESEPTDLLSTRQRFSLAHEIAHTYFYKFSSSLPAPDHAISNPVELERVCDETAARILVPTDLLKREIKGSEKIDSNFLILLARKFRTSLEVLMNRLSAVEAGDQFERCTLLIRRRSGNAEIRSSCFGVGLLPVLPRPSQFMTVTEWLADFPRRAIDQRENCSWTTPRGRKTITFHKTELRTPTDFLLQVETDHASA